MTDFEAEVPKNVEHVLGHALAPGRLLVGKQEQQIDIGARREQGAAVAALRDHRHALGRRWVLDPVDVLRGHVVDQADQRVLEVRQTAGAFASITVVLELLLRDLVRLGDERFQIGNQFRAELRVLSGMLAREFAGLLAEEIEVKIRRLS